MNGFRIMTSDEALKLLWYHASRSSQARVAKQMGVPRDALSRWKNGGAPRGKLLEKLMAWAESLPPRPAEPTLEPAMAAALEQTGANLVRLAEIRGYARSVLAMLRAVADEQQRVVDSLEPYVSAEGRTLASRLTAEDRTKILGAAEQTAAEITQPKTARRPASQG